MAVSGIVIPVDESQPIYPVTIERGDYQAYQKYVGGNFDVVNFADATYFVHDEGKVIGLDLNRRATLLLWLLDSRWRGRDVINGHAVLVGQPDDEGDTMSVPEALYDLLLNTEGYRVEVQTGTPKWDSNRIVYDDPFEAANAGLSLAERWLLVTDVRIVAVSNQAA